MTYESQAYLGIFALTGLLTCLVAALVKRAAWQAWWQQWRQAWQFRFLQVLGAAAVAGVFVAFGTEYAIADNQFVIHNYLNISFYLQKLTAAATHFRAVARFAWPFFWAVKLAVLVGLDHWLATSRWRWLAAVGLVLLAWLDTRDTLKNYHYSLLPNNLTNVANQPDVTQLLSAVTTSDYQAILPIPYFHVGSENLDLTIDDDDPHATHAYQLSLRTGLPLLASKMSRTPPRARGGAGNPI